MTPARRACLSLCLLVLGAAAAPARAAYPGRDGAIVFVGDRSGRQALYERTGRGVSEILRGGVLAGPVFSPLGRRIAVTRVLPDSGRAVWIVDPHAREVRQLTPSALAGQEPTWAPSARTLAYAAGPTGGRTIHVVAADGSGDRALTTGPADQHDPAWSVHGAVAYVQANPSGDDIYDVAASGDGLPRRLTRAPGDDAEPAWSPGGDRLAYVRRDGKRPGIWVVSRWGHGARRVAHVRGGIEHGVAWSPDGRRLLFAGGPAGRRRLYSVRLDGKRLRPLSTPASDAQDPDWQPAGRAPVIAAAGDIACDPASSFFRAGLGTTHFCGMARTANLLLRDDLWAVLALGDEQYPDGNLGRLESSFAPSWGRLGALLRPVPGNHEYATPGAAGYFDYFAGLGLQVGDRARGGYYSFDVGAWHLVALDSNCGDIPGGCGVGSPEQVWLANDLARHPAACTLAYWHHPLFSSLGTEEGGTKQTVALWQTLYDAGADVILAGHQHFYERLASQDAQGGLDATRGIRSFVVGTGGKDLDTRGVNDPSSVVFHDSSFGILELTLYPRHYAWRYRTTNGDPFTDAGSAVCH